MCGRYALYGFQPKIQEHFGTLNELDFTPRFNIAPTQSVPVVRIDEVGLRIFSLARWGLIPSWVTDSTEVQQPINAKAETAAIKPMFRHAFRKSRILVPADAFYEWQAVAEGKQPWLIHLKDDEPMGMGGLLEHWQGPQGEVMTFSILTTESNPLMAKIHDRMPVIIRPEDYAAWLDPELTDVTRIQMMAKPYPERFMDIYPVSRKVNNPLHDSADLIEEERG
ncbi:MAG: SOS response-associated peptidase [Sulfuricellaceae bacterium]|nr:SOS response-associated peptidase [Sulfuricellaceae bacterium]